jgi:hypothetical protein
MRQLQTILGCAFDSFIDEFSRISAEFASWLPKLRFRKITPEHQ